MDVHGCMNDPECSHTHPIPGGEVFTGVTNLTDPRAVGNLIRETFSGSVGLGQPIGGLSLLNVRITGEVGEFVHFSRGTPKHAPTIGRLVVDAQFREKTLIDRDSVTLQEYSFRPDFDQPVLTGQAVSQAIEANLGELKSKKTPSPVLNQLVGSLLLDRSFAESFFANREAYIQAYQAELDEGEQDILEAITLDQAVKLAQNIPPEALFQDTANVYVLFPRRHTQTEFENGVKSEIRCAPFSWLEAMSIFFQHDKASFGHDLIRALGHSHVIVVGSEDASVSISDGTFDLITRAGLPEEKLSEGYRPIVVHRIKGTSAKEIKGEARRFYRKGFKDFLRMTSTR